MTTNVTKPLIDPAVWVDLALSGNPTAPTQSVSDDSTKIATTAFVQLVNAALSAIIATALNGKQPLDSDLTAIAALTTTAIGRSLLAGADAAALRSIIGAQVAGSYQPLDSDLTAIAALTTTAFGRGFLDQVDATTALAKLGIVSTDFTPTLAFGGASVGMAGTFLGRKLKLGRHVWISYDIRLTAKGTSTGSAFIGLPVDAAVGVAGSGRVGLYSGMAALTGGIDTYQNVGSSSLSLNTPGAAANTPLTATTHFTDTSVIVGEHQYIAAP